MTEEKDFLKLVKEILDSPAYYEFDGNPYEMKFSNIRAMVETRMEEIEQGMEKEADWREKN